MVKDIDVVQFLRWALLIALMVAVVFLLDNLHNYIDEPITQEPTQEQEQVYLQWHITWERVQQWVQEIQENPSALIPQLIELRRNEQPMSDTVNNRANYAYRYCLQLLKDVDLSKKKFDYRCEKMLLVFSHENKLREPTAVSKTNDHGICQLHYGASTHRKFIFWERKTPTSLVSEM